MIRGSNLNTINLRSTRDGFSIQDPNYSVVPNVLERLRLLDGHKSILCKLADEHADMSALVNNWYALGSTVPDEVEECLCEEISHLVSFDVMRAATRISLDEYRQLIRDDVIVEDESGFGSDKVPEYDNIFARFFLGQYAAKVDKVNDFVYTRYFQIGTEQDFVNSLPDKQYAIINFCIRLQKRT